MMPGYNAQQIKARLLVWWGCWAASLGGVILVYFVVIGDRALPPVSREHPLQGLIGFVPLFVSIVIRWLVLPRATNPNRAFRPPVGMFAGGPYRDSLVLGVLGVPTCRGRSSSTRRAPATSEQLSRDHAIEGQIS
jgi:hypothetical protein